MGNETKPVSAPIEERIFELKLVAAVVSTPATTAETGPPIMLWVDVVRLQATIETSTSKGWDASLLIVGRGDLSSEGPETLKLFAPRPSVV